MVVEKKSSLDSQRALSAFICALLFFVALNLTLKILPTNQAQMSLCDRYEFPYHGWSYWSLKAIRDTDPSRSNIVWLGSSLVVAAIAECDATMANKPLDLCFYKGAKYFDGAMKERFGRDYNTFDLSTPGQIPSDAYLTLKAALDSGIKPGIVIYGIAPRDFIDQTLADPCDTEPFRYLSRLVDIQDCADDLYKTPIAKLDWTLQQTLPLYGQSAALNATFKTSCANVIELPLLRATAPFRQRIMDTPIAKVLPDFQTFDKAPGTNFALPAKGRGPFLDNSEDYKNRYRKPDQLKYSVQMRFFERLVKLCQSNEIDVIPVNMPITSRNAVLLNDTWQKRYIDDISRICYSHNVPFLNQCDFAAYSLEDYRDTVHLNAFGAKKFIDRLVERLAKEPRTGRSIISAGDPGNRAVASHTEGEVAVIH